MRSASAPYVVTILLSISSWFLLTFYEQIGEMRVLAYEWGPDRRASEGNASSLRLTNASPRKAITNAEVTIRCADNIHDCFAEEGTRAVSVPPWSVDSQPLSDKRSITQFVNLPPGMSVDVRFVKIDMENEIVILIGGDEFDKSVIITNEIPFDVLIGKNFVYIVAALWIFAVLFILFLYRKSIIGLYIYRHEKSTAEVSPIGLIGILIVLLALGVISRN